MRICIKYVYLIVGMIQVIAKHDYVRPSPTDMPFSQRDLINKKEKMKSYLQNLNSFKVMQPEIISNSSNGIADLLVEDEKIRIPLSEGGLNEVSKMRLDQNKLNRYLQILEMEIAKTSPATIEIDPEKIIDYIRMLNRMAKVQSKSNDLISRSRIKLLKSIMTDGPDNYYLEKEPQLVTETGSNKNYFNPIEINKKCDAEGAEEINEPLERNNIENSVYLNTDMLSCVEKVGKKNPMDSHSLEADYSDENYQADNHFLNNDYGANDSSRRRRRPYNNKSSFSESSENKELSREVINDAHLVESSSNLQNSSNITYFSTSQVLRTPMSAIVRGYNLLQDRIENNGSVNAADLEMERKFGKPNFIAETTQNKLSINNISQEFHLPESAGSKASLDYSENIGQDPEHYSLFRGAMSNDLAELKEITDTKGRREMSLQNIEGEPNGSKKMGLEETMDKRPFQHTQNLEITIPLNNSDSMHSKINENNYVQLASTIDNTKKDDSDNPKMVDINRSSGVPIAVANSQPLTSLQIKPSKQNSSNTSHLKNGILNYEGIPCPVKAKSAVENLIFSRTSFDEKHSYSTETYSSSNNVALKSQPDSGVPLDHKIYPLKPNDEIISVPKMKCFKECLPNENTAFRGNNIPTKPPQMYSKYYLSRLKKLENYNHEENISNFLKKPMVPLFGTKESEVSKILNVNLEHLHIDKGALYKIIGKALKVDDENSVDSAPPKWLENKYDELLHASHRGQTLIQDSYNEEDFKYPIYPRSMIQRDSIKTDGEGIDDLRQELKQKVLLNNNDIRDKCEYIKLNHTPRT